ncbi:hypothetical protein BgiBS90_006041 [Biomphalaria glabrata]|nr:hypothetical protein BgiBS90_006041 [Biomphalaria glabrata]
MSFHVRPRPQSVLSIQEQSPLNIQASLLPCSGWIYYMDTGTFEYPLVTTATPQEPEMANQGNNTELLIIMLSIISGFSLVLLVILVLVCIRCHLLQTSHTEYLYTETSSGLQEHNQYISSLENEKPRPRLADGYYEVADAIPPSQRGTTPTSPAYAEVETIVNLRKGPWMENDIKLFKPSLLKTDDKISIKTGDGLLNGRLKFGTLPVMKEENVKSDNNISAGFRNSTGPVIIAATLKKKNLNSESIIQNEVTTSITSSSVQDDGSPTYEPIGDCPVKKSTEANSESVSQRSPGSKKKKVKNCLDNQTYVDLENYSKTWNRDPGKATNAKANGVVLDTQFKGNNILTKDGQKVITAASTRNNVRTTGQKSDVVKIQDGSKTLPNKNTRGFLEIHAMKNNNYKFSDCSDLQSSKGIVRNGIRMFEKNKVPDIDSLSNS